MDALIKKLQSRKFLLVVSSAIFLLANKQYPEAAAAIVAYLVGESAIDATRINSESKPDHVLVTER